MIQISDHLRRIFTINLHFDDILHDVYTLHFNRLEAAKYIFNGILILIFCYETNSLILVV